MWIVSTKSYLASENYNLLLHRLKLAMLRIPDQNLFEPQRTVMALYWEFERNLSYVWL